MLIELLMLAGIFVIGYFCKEGQTLNFKRPKFDVKKQNVHIKHNK